MTFQTMTDDAAEMAREYQSNQTPPLPSNLLQWAAGHSDAQVRSAAAEITLASLEIVMRFDEDAAPLSFGAKLAFFERRLRQAVREGNAKATTFPSAYWYGTYDLTAGAYGRLAEAFAILRDRLLATKRIDAADLARLPTGHAAAKLEQPDGSMRQCLLRFPLAITPEHSLIVKTLFDHEGAPPALWPAELDSAYVAAGARARRIRERTRQQYTPVTELPMREGEVFVSSTLNSSQLPNRPALPVQFEVDLD